MVKKRAIKNKSNPNTKKTNFDKILIENFVSLQEVMTNLSLKFDGLSSQISKLLELFEISAKSLAEKNFDSETENKGDKEIIDKLDSLINQNKIIARGLTLLHETTPQKKIQSPPPVSEISKFPEQKSSAEMNKYQRSIS